MTLLEKIREVHAQCGQGALNTNASDESLALEFNEGFGEENTLDGEGICWCEKNIYDVTCYDGANGIAIYPRHPENGRVI